MKRQTQPTTRDGFTLPETAITATIVAIMLIPLVAMMGLISSFQKKSSDDMLSMIFAETVIQTLQGTPSGSGQKTELIWTFPYIEGNNIRPSPVTIQFPASSGTTSETIMVGDQTGRLVRTAYAHEYLNGIRNSPISQAFLVRILIERKSVEDSASKQLIPGSSEVGFDVFISVEHPITAANVNRVKKTFRSHCH